MSYQPVISRRAEMDLAHQYRWYLDNASGNVAEEYLTAVDASIASRSRIPTPESAANFVHLN